MEFLQLFIGLSGLAFGLVLIHLRKPKQDNLEEPNSKVKASLKAMLEAPHNLVDLCFIFAASAYFVLLLIDSLIISGRTPTPDIFTLLAVCVIAVFPTGFMIYSWKHKQSELGVGITAFVVLLLLCFAPGGAFVEAPAKIGESGMDLLLPQMILLTILAGVVIYTKGNPFSKTLPSKEKWLILGLLLGCLMMTLVSRGLQYEDKVASDFRTPKTTKGPDQDFLDGIRNDLSNVELSHFYQLASEIRLSSNYRSTYEEVVQDFQPLESQGGSGRGSSIFQDQRFSSLFRAAPAKDDGGYRNKRQNQAFIDPNLVREVRMLLTTDLHQQFMNLTSDQQIDFFVNRSRWVHLLGEPGIVADYNLPGVSTYTRMNNLSEGRVAHLLLQQKILSNNFQKVFEYPESRQNLRNNVDYLDGDYDNNYEDAQRHGMKALFPEFEPSFSGAVLRQQLALPNKYEHYLAYLNYLELAETLESDPKLKSLVQEFVQELDWLNQKAILALMNDPNQREYLETLVFYMDLDFSAFSLTDDPSAANTLLNLINQLQEKEVPSSQGIQANGSDGTMGDSLISGLEMQQPAATLEALAEAIVKKLDQESPEARENHLKGLQRLLLNGSSSLASRHFFRKGNAAFCHQLVQLDSNSFRELKLDLQYPAHLLLEAAAKQVAPDNTVFLNHFAAFCLLTPKQQESSLHHLAILQYRSGGEYALNPFDMLVVKAKVLSPLLAIIFAALYWLPFYLFSMLIGGFIARKLVSRELIRKVIVSESDLGDDDTHEIGSAVAFSGRESILNQMVTLAGRGWASIALVGRRGIGKSRVLFELTKNDASNRAVSRISAWVSAPSKYSEEDFLSSVLERLAYNTENTIANYLGAKPLSVRKAESSAATLLFLLYVGVLMVLLFSLGLSIERLQVNDVMVIWIPLWLLIIASAVMLVYHLTRIQPVNLSAWMQRDRSHNPHAIFLYQETQEVLSFIRKRTVNDSSFQFMPGSNVFQKILFINLVLLSIFSFCFAILNALDRSNFLFHSGFVFGIGLSILSAVLANSVYKFRANREEYRGGQSLMTLVARYRNYAASVVGRLQSGALGGGPNPENHVVICIDEVDKIVDMGETRSFVRQIKAMFEIPGVYYYVSLAEDALEAMYLGAAEGKNEIDSAFDHVVRIAPLAHTTGSEIAAHYFRKRKCEETLIASLAQVASALSFGVARDIFRRSDELLAAAAIQEHPVKGIARFRELQAQMAFNAHRITKEEMRLLCQEPQDVFQNLLNWKLEARDPNSAGIEQVLLLVRVLVNMELVLLELPKAEQDNSLALLADLGYRIPIETTHDLMEELKVVESKNK